MATETLSTADAVLKDLYRGPIIEQLNYKTYMLDMIQRDEDRIDFTGRRAIVPVHSAANPSEGSFGDGGTLPTPGVEGYLDAIIPIRYHGRSIELTDQLIKQAKGNEGAFVSVFDNDTGYLAKNMRKGINRQVFGDGLGTLATLATSPAGSTTFTVDSTQYLKIGQVIDVRTKTTGALENGGNVSLTITAINRTTKVVTVSANVTATTTTAGVYIAGSYGNESDGLRNISATTSRTLHSLNSATAGNEFWNPNVRDAQSAIAGEGLFEQLADDVGGVGQGDVDVFLTSRGIRRRLADTYQSQKRFNDARAVDIHGGYTAIFVNEIPVIADDDVPKGFAFALSKDAFLWVQVEDPDWLADPKSGTVWQLAPGSVLGTHKTAWRAYFVWYASLASVAPNRTGAIINAADDSA
jgi:hypothetical protein